MSVQAEISYDLVMENDMSFVEGCYRLPGRPWEVFIFSKRKIDQPEHRFGQWDSGVTGINVFVPVDTTLNKCRVEELLSSALGIAEWREVRGPDAFRALKAPIQPVCLHELRGQLGSGDVWAVSAAAALAVARLLSRPAEFPLDLGGWTIEEEGRSPPSSEGISPGAKSVSPTLSG
jgi:hypothetical protein